RRAMLAERRDDARPRNPTAETAVGAGVAAEARNGVRSELQRARPVEPLDREVDGLGAPAREHDLDRVDPERTGDRFAPLLEQFARGLAWTVDRRRIAD